MRSILQRVDRAYREALEALPWLRVILPLLLGAVGGSTFVGFINRYALYNYAVAYGARLPVERVPYLDLAVSLLSFLFLAVTLLSAVLIYWGLNAVAQFLQARLAGLGTKWSGRAARALVGLLAGSLNLVYTLFREGLPEVGGLADWVWLVVPYAIVAVALASVLISAALWPRHVKNASYVVAGGLILLISCRLFLPDNYAGFLRSMRYGGGTPVAVVSETTEGIQHVVEGGHLFLTTDTHVVLWLDARQSFSEIPVSHVREVRHELERGECLPGRVGSLLDVFEEMWPIELLAPIESVRSWILRRGRAA